MTTYLFYDLETSGLSKPFDQIQQFAGKRLDRSFNEVESCFLEAKIAPDIIPSPYAVMTHQISLDGDDARMTEQQAVEQIHAMINQPNTISIGYNTLGFDDEFLRFAFYRHLLAPYTHQYANGCTRFDVFPLAVFYFLYEKEALGWPEIDGKVSLKLEHIVTENDWFQGRAHHAMNDVDATIRLAKHLQEANPEMWQYLIGYFDKKIDQDRIAALPQAFKQHEDFRYGLMVNAKFGANHTYQSMVLALGSHLHYKNQTTWLRLDKCDLTSLDFAECESQGLIIRKKYAEPGFLLPPSEHFTRHMSLDRMKQVEKNLQIIQKDFQHFEIIQQEARAYTYPDQDNIDVDAGLYELGFQTRDEQQWCRDFHVALPAAKKILLDTMKNPHIKEQAQRMIWRADQNSDPDIQQQMQSIIQKIYQENEKTGIFDYRGFEKRGLRDVLHELREIEQSGLDSEQQLAINQFKNWLQVRRQKSR